MKRIGYLHEKIYIEDNINLADSNARKNKRKRSDIKEHDKDKDFENFILSLDIRNLEYKTSPYHTFTIREPKERIIFKLPYYPDRIAHHAIMNIMEPIWRLIFIDHTYSSIKNRGIHKLSKDLKRVLQCYPDKTTYCLKLDIHKFYPSINHDILYEIIQKKIKDLKVLCLLKEIIYSAKGVPIGNYLSQYFANLYLTYFDHWIKEELKCKYYFRYADDVVILSDNKNYLRNVLLAIKLYLKIELKLELKPNYLIFPVESRGIDFVGYKFYHTHTLLRKSIKLRMFKLINKYLNKELTKEELNLRMRSYFGWLKYCDSKHLLLKIEKLTGLKFSNFNGLLVNISNFYGKCVYVVEIVSHNKYFEIHFIYRNKPYYFKSTNNELFSFLILSNTRNIKI